MNTKQKMEKLRITDRKQLKRRIAELNREMEQKEEQLKSDLKEVHQSLRASNLIRNAIKDIKDQPALQMGIAQAAADIGAHALIDKLLFRHKKPGIKNYVLSILLKKIADHFILKVGMKVHQTGNI
jgi:hypothetical protein